MAGDSSAVMPTCPARYANPLPAVKAVDGIRIISILSTAMPIGAASSRQRVRESFSRLPGHLIRRLHQQATAYFAEECGGDLTAVQYAALVAIGSHPGIDATRLAEIIYFDRSTIGDVLDRMEGKGWIVRASTATDRRVKLLTLSPAGEDVLHHVEPGIARVQERLLAPLTASEARTLVRLPARMAETGSGETANER